MSFVWRFNCTSVTNLFFIGLGGSNGSGVEVEEGELKGNDDSKGFRINIASSIKSFFLGGIAGGSTSGINRGSTSLISTSDSIEIIIISVL